MFHVTVFLAALALLVAPAPVAANGLEGIWRTASGDHVEVHACGDSHCITVVSGDGKGLEISRDLVADGTGRFAGKLFNPRDGRTYAGSATVVGEGRLTLKGCALKIFCKTQTWTRVR